MRRFAIVIIALAGIACGSGRTGSIKASGTIEATQVSVAAKTGGQILRLMVDEGGEVKPGDTIALIDHATLDLQLRQAQAGLALARAQLDGDRRDSERNATLFASGSATAKQRDDAATRWQGSRARYDQAAAAADLIRKQIADCAVTAPARGTVTVKAFEAGETVAPGATLVTISQLDRVNLMIYVTEQELARIKLGQQAQVSIDAFKNRTYAGTVVYVSPAAEFTPKNVQTTEDRVKQVFGVKLEIANASRELKPGLPADANVLTQ